MKRDYFRTQTDWKFWIAILVILFLLGLVGGMEMREQELRQHILLYEISK